MHCWAASSRDALLHSLTVCIALTVCLESYVRAASVLKVYELAVIVLAAAAALCLEGAACAHLEAGRRVHDDIEQQPIRLADCWSIPGRTASPIQPGETVRVVAAAQLTPHFVTEGLDNLQFWSFTYGPDFRGERAGLSLKSLGLY